MSQQPHEVVLPDIKLPATTIVRLPSSQTQCQHAFPCLLFCARASTVSRPNFCPVKSRNAGIFDILTTDRRQHDSRTAIQNVYNSPKHQCCGDEKLPSFSRSTRHGGPR